MTLFEDWATTLPPGQQPPVAQPPATAEEILGTLSHELRTPLTAIKGYATTLMRHDAQLTSEERQGFLETIQLSSDRLGSVIDRLLRLAHLLVGLAQIKRETLDLHELAQAAVAQAIAHTATAAPAYTITLNGPTAEQPLLLCGDIVQVREVLDHVLENAVKYAPAGGQITMTLQRGQAADGRPIAMIAVSDEGIGIAPEYLEQIFDPFFRVDRGLTRESSGIGAGLAICRTIVQLHGGAMWAESQLGQGTTMHLTLPLA